MKNILRLGLCMAAAVWAAVASAEEKTELYTNKDLGFTIEYPAAWQEGEIKGETIVVAFTGGDIRRTLQVMHDKGGEEAGVACLDKLGDLLKQRVRKAEWKEVNGRRAFLQEAEWKNVMGVSVAIRLLVPVHEEYFLVMATCPLDEFEKLRPLIEKCVLTFTITKK